MESTSQFENLPTEVLLHILTSIADVHCLWSVLAASPASYRVFNQYGDEIFWPAVSHGTVPSQTQDIIRLVLLLRAGAFPETTLDDVTRKIKDREAGIVLGKSEELGYDFATADSSKAPSLSIQRRVLSVAGKIRCLGRLCIRYYFDRLAAAISEGRLDWAYGEETVMVPSWVEENRVIRAFWRIQLLHELKLAARESRVLCPPGDVEGSGLDIEGFYDSSTSNLKAAHHEVMTAMEFLGESPDFRNRPSASFRDRLPSPTWPIGDTGPSTLRMPDTSSTRRSSLVLPTDGLWIVDSMSRGAHSPIKYAGFEPYRSLGFAIWDRQRLADMGLASPPGQGRVTGLGSYFSYWLRLLSPGDLARAAESMREAESQGGRLGPLQPVIQDIAS